MKLKLKQRLQIFDRAYDKAAKGIKLAEVEQIVLQDAISYSRELAQAARRHYRDQVWHEFGWDTEEAKTAYNKMIKEKCYGQSI